METKQQLSIPVGLQTIYFNGVGVGMGAVDMSIILNHNQIPTTELKLSYPVAKTLATTINQVIANYEKHTGQLVEGAQELSIKFNAAAVAAAKSAS